MAANMPVLVHEIHLGLYSSGDFDRELPAVHRGEISPGTCGSDCPDCATAGKYRDDMTAAVGRALESAMTELHGRWPDLTLKIT